MSFIWQCRLALRLLWREGKSGELNLIFWALLLAVTSATTIALFSSRLELAMQQKALEVLGADLRLESTAPIQPHWLERSQQLGLDTTITVHFPTMVLAGDAMAMAAVKVVGAGYPLKSELHLANPAQPEEPLLQQQGPAAGEVWVEARLAQLLNAQPGEYLEVGRSQLRLSGIIAKESDRGGGFYSFSPRLMMNHTDLAAADLIGTGSRVRWRLLMVGDAMAVAQMQQFTLADNEKFQTLENSNQALSQRLDNARRYLGLAAMLAVVLACVAVAMSAKQYAERNFAVSALMRTFGLERKQVLTIYIVQLLGLTVLATALGILLANLGQHSLLWLLAEVLPAQLPAAPLSAWLLGASTAGISLLGFAVPYMLPLARVSPLKVLRQELAPAGLSSWLLNGLALATLAGLLWLFTQDWVLTVLTLGGSLLVLGLLFAMLMGLLSCTQNYLSQRSLPLVWRFAWQHLTLNKKHSAGQIIAFALTLMVMVLIFTLRNDLLADWQNDLPEDTPNVFAINIQPYELEPFQQQLAKLELQPQTFYPTLAARLVSINQQAVAELPIAKDSSVNRDLVLAAESKLPENNQLVAGEWHGDSSNLEVSVEQELAQRLNIQMGDELTFNLAGQLVAVKVTSFREVNWGAMTPNFFMLLSPAAFNNQPINYMVSFQVPESSHALTELIRAYPSITFFDVSAVLAQIQTLLQQVTLAIEWILLFVLLSALLVMLAAITAGLEGRLREGAIVRTLGASSALLQRAQMAEFALLGLLSALVALLGAEALRLILYQYFLQLSWSSLGWFWLGLPLLTMLLLVLPSQWLLRPIVHSEPLQVLRRV